MATIIQHIKILCMGARSAARGGRTETVLEALDAISNAAAELEEASGTSTNSDYTAALKLINDIQHYNGNVLLVDHRKRAMALLSRLHFPKEENDV